MIYRSGKYNTLSDASGDQGDSAMRSGIAELTEMSSEPLHLYEQPFKTGLLRRSPDQYPWTNPLNFSRDQMLPFVAAMSKRGMYSTIRRFFVQRVRNFFFMQNIERDEPGTMKYPFPHKVKASKYGKEETRLFDFADPLLPQHVWHIIKAGQIKWLYWFGIIGIPFFLLDMLLHGMSKSKYEENQMFAMAYVQGEWALKLYKRFGFSEVVSKRYWNDRGEDEYHEAIVKVLDEKTT